MSIMPGEAISRDRGTERLSPARFPSKSRQEKCQLDKKKKGKQITEVLKMIQYLPEIAFKFKSDTCKKRLLGFFNTFFYDVKRRV